MFLFSSFPTFPFLFSCCKYSSTQNRSCAFEYKPFKSRWIWSNAELTRTKHFFVRNGRIKNHCYESHMQGCELLWHYRKYGCQSSKILPVKLKTDEASTQHQFRKRLAPQGRTHTHILILSAWRQEALKLKSGFPHDLWMIRSSLLPFQARGLTLLFT